MKNPPFKLTNQIVSDGAEIAELVGWLETLNPYSIDDLLTAQGVMMWGLEQEAGEFRSRPAGIVNQAGEIVHLGTLPQYVPEAVTNLLEWVEGGELPMLIRSCVFRCELELTHPFADGNSRAGWLCPSPSLTSATWRLSGS